MNQRIAVVTGGIGGLGTAICIALAQAGRRVVAADLGARTERIAEFQRETEGLDIRFEPVDVTDFESCGQLARKVEAELGSIDILVNAAGITRDTTLRKIEPSQ
jgi:acetoacetyl-CoA reductase